MFPGESCYLNSLRAALKPSGEENLTYNDFMLSIIQLQRGTEDSSGKRHSVFPVSLCLQHWKFISFAVSITTQG